MDIRKLIILLEIKQKEERNYLLQECLNIYENLKPINVIKSTIKEVAQSNEIGENLLGTGVGLTAEFLTKVLVGSVLQTPATKLIGIAMMYGVSNVIAKNRDKVKAMSTGIFKYVKSKIRAKTIEYEDGIAIENPVYQLEYNS
jgi:hypothetical protein